jgi:hypothetical protein
MRNFIASRAKILGVALSLVLVFALFGLTLISAEEPDSGSVEEAHKFQGPAPVLETFEWSAEPPPLTEEQRAQLEYGIEHTHLPGPALDYGAAADVTGPVAGTESALLGGRSRSGEPLLPGDAMMFQGTSFGGVIPDGYNSNVMESSVGHAGRYAFFTGNWFAAHSFNGGKNWNYVSAWTGFPDFCCDQVVIYDEARDIFLWERMGLPDFNWENVFKLSVFQKKWGGAWWTYTIAPTDINPAWANEWWDYPHIQLGADYMYMAWNMFDQNENWVRTVMLRVDLDQLAAAGGFSGSYWYSEEWFTFVPVQGGYHTMYWASNWNGGGQYNFAIWKWQEDETTIYYYPKNVTPWTPTGRYDAVCGSPNWTARLDQRVMTGARYSINREGCDEEPKILGRKILGWWWNVAQGGGFPLPYVDGAAFYEDTLTQVAGWRGRPYVWSDYYCFAYPSCTPNKRQDLGMVFHYAYDPKWRPNVGYSIADDYFCAPPGWWFFNVISSKALPSDEVWGDYNTVREFEPTQKVWVAGSHRIPTKGNCAVCSEPIHFIFGRERDYQSWWRWRKK